MAGCVYTDGVSRIHVGGQLVKTSDGKNHFASALAYRLLWDRCLKLQGRNIKRALMLWAEKLEELKGGE